MENKQDFFLYKVCYLLFENAMYVYSTLWSYLHPLPSSTKSSQSAPIHSFASSPFLPHPPSSYMSCSIFFLYITFQWIYASHIPMTVRCYWSMGHTALPIHIHKYVNDYFTLSMNTFRIFHLPFHALSTAVYVGAYTLTGWFSFSSYWSLIIFSC